MPARFRVALRGFSDFERSTLGLCFRLAPTRVPAYEEVDDLAQADFIVADADAAGVIATLSQADRLADVVFIGARPVAGALAHARRPIDPINVVRELDALAALRATAARRKAAAPPPELTDDVTAEVPPAPSPPERDDAGEPTRPYVRVADLDEGPGPDVVITEMFVLPDVFVPEPAPAPVAAERRPRRRSKRAAARRSTSTCHWMTSHRRTRHQCKAQHCQRRQRKLHQQSQRRSGRMRRHKRRRAHAPRRRCVATRRSWSAAAIPRSKRWCSTTATSLRSTSGSCSRSSACTCTSQPPAPRHSTC